MELQALSPKIQSTFSRRYPSRLIANIYLLAGIGLLILIGRIVEHTLAQYLIGCLAEMLLVVIAVLCVKLDRLPVKTTMRINWPGWEFILLSIITAPGLWMMGVALNVITSLLFGYTTPTPPQMYPTNLIESLGFLLTAVIIAPICEELMFRGYIQPAYERGKPYAGIVIGGLIFALYHMQFQGLFALIPVALVLGVFSWRTNSIIPGMVLHAGYNAIASIILVTATFLPYQLATAVLFSLILIGFIGVIVTFLAIGRLFAITQPAQLTPPQKSTSINQWIWLIPLLLLAIVYVFGSINEVIAGRFPELLAAEEITFKLQPTWQEKHSWEYDIQDFLGTYLGKVECEFNPQDSMYSLSCSGSNQNSSLRDYIPIEIPWLTQKLDVAAAEWEREVVWQGSSLQLTEFNEYQLLENRIMQMEPNGQKLSVLYEDKPLMQLDIPGDILVPGEWPWRLTGLTMQLFYGGSLPLVVIDEEGLLSLEEAFITVKSAEPTWTPAGAFITWKVTVTYMDNSGREFTESAWYDVEPPHSLIRYDDGKLSYMMRSNNIQDD